MKERWKILQKGKSQTSKTTGDLSVGLQFPVPTRILDPLTVPISPLGTEDKGGENTSLCRER